MVPGLHRLLQLPRQLLFRNPFKGDVATSRVWITRPESRDDTLPFPHPWNYRQPLEILETFFSKAGGQAGSAKHNRFLEVPFFSPVLITREPPVIRAVLTATGDKEGQFDRDTMPSTGIARATGADTLLFSNGPSWRHQRKASAQPFGKNSLYQPEVFQGFEATFRKTILERIQALHKLLAESHEDSITIQLEPEIKTVMLEMLVNNFFGAKIEYTQLREKYIPAIDRIIEHIVRDTVRNRFDMNPLKKRRVSRRSRQLREDFEAFEELTDIAIEPRHRNQGAWARLSDEFSDESIRSNVKVFLAGALEATTSYATWAISHLARNSEAQEQVFREVAPINAFSPDVLEQTQYLSRVLKETLRLTPSLYFLPRRAQENTWLTLHDGRRMYLPKGTHILLDVWHANRLEEFWGVEATGAKADVFAPERWEHIERMGAVSKDFLHFGFGHGARVCPGKHLGELEIALVVGSICKLFVFKAIHQINPAKAGVSTKPLDGTLVELRLRKAD